MGTEAGVYVFNWTQKNGQKVVSNPKLLSTENWVLEMAFTPDKQFLFATMGNHLSQFKKVNGHWLETQLVEDKSAMEYLSIQPIDAGQQNIWFTTEQQELYRLSRLGGKVDLDTLLKFTNPSAPLGKEHLRPFVYQQRMLIGTQNGVIEYHHMDTPEFTLTDDLPNALRTPNKDVFKIELDEKQRIWYHAGRDTGVIYKDDSDLYVAQETLFKPYNHSGTRGLAYVDNAIWFGVASARHQSTRSRAAIASG